MRAASSKNVIKALTKAERETVVVEFPGCGVVLLDSTVKTGTSRTRRSAHYYAEIAAGYYGSTEWVRFSLPADRWNTRPGGAAREWTRSSNGAPKTTGLDQIDRRATGRLDKWALSIHG